MEIADRGDGPSTSCEGPKRSVSPRVLDAALLAMLALDTVDDAVVVVEPDGEVRSYNAAAERILGSIVRCPGMYVFDLIELCDGVRLEALIRCCLADGEKMRLASRGRARCPGAVSRDLELTVAPLRADGEIVGGALVLRDVSRSQDLRRVLEHRASHDGLASLMNRGAFLQHVAAVLERTAAHDTQAILFLDLDHDKRVSDTVGHAAGDAVLREVTAVFRDFVRQRDVLARLGGDEFALLLEHCPRERAVSVAEEIRRAIRARSFRSGGREFRLDVSIGVAAIRGRQVDTARWIAAADRACRATKRRQHRRAAPSGGS